MPSRKKTVAATPAVDLTQLSEKLMRRLQRRYPQITTAAMEKAQSAPPKADADEVKERRKAIIAHAQKATGISAEDFALRLAIQAAAFPVGRDAEGDPAKARELVSTAVETLEQIKPAGALQSMLVVQMIGVHNTAIKFLMRATDKDQSFEGADAHVLRATRLMRLFNDQLEALASLRGKTSEQKVTVEHVHVYEGGQAIVGNIAKGEGRE